MNYIIQTQNKCFNFILNYPLLNVIKINYNNNNNNNNLIAIFITNMTLLTSIDLKNGLQFLECCNCALLNTIPLINGLERIYLYGLPFIR